MAVIIIIMLVINEKLKFRFLKCLEQLQISIEPNDQLEGFGWTNISSDN